MTQRATVPAPVQFCGAATGNWRVRRQVRVSGPPLAAVSHLDTSGNARSALWTLTGLASNLRYTDAAERADLLAVQAPLARPEARISVLIPIRKSAAWWAMAQDERLAIYRRGAHFRIGRDYLPAIARRLLHSRDLGEPFDFLTWFDFAPEHESDFDHMLERLRASEEWRFVDREIEFRLESA